jgi:hypothetical protein
MWNKNSQSLQVWNMQTETLLCCSSLRHTTPLQPGFFGYDSPPSYRSAAPGTHRTQTICRGLTSTLGSIRPVLRNFCRNRARNSSVKTLTASDFLVNRSQSTTSLPLYYENQSLSLSKITEDGRIVADGDDQSPVLLTAHVLEKSTLFRIRMSEIRVVVLDQVLYMGHQVSPWYRFLKWTFLTCFKLVPLHLLEIIVPDDLLLAEIIGYLRNQSLFLRLLRRMGCFTPPDLSELKPIVLNCLGRENITVILWATSSLAQHAMADLIMQRQSSVARLEGVLELASILKSPVDDEIYDAVIYRMRDFLNLTLLL